MTEWATAVARRAGVEPAYAEQVLEQYHVRPTAALPSPRRLLVSRIRFSGEKVLDGHKEKFDFDFSMGAGVWCVASDGENLAGKSSVLEILLWALRGRSHVQPDVQRWLARVELWGAVDQDEFSIEYNVLNGIPQGELILAKPQRRAIATFRSGAEFEEVMHEFMLNRLGLIPTPFWQGKAGDQDGTPSNVSWAGYSQALYIPNGSHQALLGDEFMGGQAGKLLQVFIGLPWAHTHAAAQVAAKARKQFLRNSIRRRSERREG